MSLLDYKKIRIFDTGNNSETYFATRDNDQAVVVIRSIKNQEKTAVQYLHNSCKILQGLSHPSIEEFIDYIQDDFSSNLITKGRSLDSLSINGHIKKYACFSIDQFLSYAIKITEAINYLHKSGIMHKNINPYNIFILPIDASIHISGFEFSETLIQKHAIDSNLNAIEGNLYYIAPEQSGRTNRSYDYRVDFYSLGLVFYEMLIGRSPIEAQDKLEVLYYHLTKIPPSLNISNINIPNVICKIVAKLLSKSANDRYSTAESLLDDLTKSRELLTANNTIEDFAIAAEDYITTWEMPHKIYGLTNELQNLKDKFDAMFSKHKNKNIALISGLSGSGKTCLVKDLYNQIVLHKGYLISGKFDQYKKNYPYFAIQQALTGLALYFQSEPEEDFLKIKAKILEVVDGNGKILTNIVPEMVNIIGEQPEVEELPIKENQTRINILLRKIFIAFADKMCPIVLFMDDLQWADYSSITLFEDLYDNDVPFLFFIGAYRNNEVENNSLFGNFLTKIANLPDFKQVLQINVTSLNLDNVVEIIQDITNQPTDKCVNFAQAVLGKTAGNPFFIQQFLNYLYDNKFIDLDKSASLQQGKATWIWEINNILNCEVTSNVIDLLLNKIDILSKEQAIILQYASVIGNGLHNKILSTVTNLNEDVTILNLYSLVKIGMLLITRADRVNSMFYFKFAHDKIQESAYKSIPSDKMLLIHYQVGESLLKVYNKSHNEVSLIDVVFHLNYAISLITSQEKKDILIKLNLSAAKELMASASYDVASNYLQTGMVLLGENGWEKNYNLTLDFYNNLQKIASFKNDVELLLHNHNIIIKNSKDIIDTMYSEMHVMVYKRTTCKAEEIPLLLAEPVKKANLLGANILINPTEEDAQQAYMLTLNLLKNYSFTNEHKNNASKKTMTILELVANSIMSAAYAGEEKFLIIILHYIINSHITHGESKFSAIAFAWFGNLLVNKAEYEFGYKCANYSYLLTKDNKTAFKDFVMMMFSITAVCKVKLQEIQIIARKSIDEAYKGGDLELAGVCYGGYLTTMLFANQSLENFIKIEWENYVSHKELFVLERHEISKATMLTAQKLLEPLADNDINPDFNIKDPLAINKSLTYTYTVMYNCILNRFSENIKVINDCSNEYLVPPLVYERYLFEFYAALSIYNVIDVTALNFTDASEWQKASMHQDSLKAVASHAPMNFLHKWHILEAERNKIVGNEFSACNQYYIAINMAKDNDMMYDEALANELLARFFISKGMEFLAKKFILQAFALYAQWGCRKKTDLMLQDYPLLLQLEDDIVILQKCINLTQTNIATTADKSAKDITPQAELNFNTIIKLSRTISEELNLNNLLKKFVYIALENLGANKCFLVLQENDSLVVKIKFFNKDIILIDKAAKAEHQLSAYSNDLSCGCIMLCLKQKKSILLNVVEDTEKISTDVYIKALLRNKQEFSILCAPIKNKDDILGVIYVEQTLYNCFPEESVEMLNVLSSQAAISIQNSNLYNNLEEKVIERTKELSDALNTLNATKDELIASEKMASLGRLIQSIAHEINTPIGNGLLGGSIIQNHLDKSADKIDVPLISDGISLVMSNLNFVAQVIKQLKSISEFSNEKSKNDVELHSFISDIASGFRAGNNNTEIRINSKVQHLIVNTYVKNLKMLLENILENCFVHSYPNNEKVIIDINYGYENSKNFISIIDYGVGILPEHIDKIYEPFFTTLFGASKRVGLGLYIVNCIVAQILKGTIICVSKKSRTEFKVCF